MNRRDDGPLIRSRSMINRRTFLRVGTSALAATAVTRAVSAAATAAVPPGFTFVVANDLHYRDGRCVPWFEKVVASIRSLRPRPAFVLLAGDLSETGAREELGAVRELFRTLPVPIKAVIGNHDHNATEGRKPFGEIFQTDLNARFEFGEWHFLMLDTTEGKGVFRTRISDETLHWVRQATATLEKDKPVIVLTHFPLGRNWLRPVNAAVLLDALKRCHFRGSFGGHWHGWTEPVEDAAPLITGRCCSWWRTNHDGSDDKGYFLCQAIGDRLTHRFIAVPVA